MHSAKKMIVTAILCMQLPLGATNGNEMLNLMRALQSSGFTAISLNSDDTLVAGVSPNNTIHIFDVATGNEKHHLSTLSSKVIETSFDSRGTNLLIKTADGRRIGWNLVGDH